MTKQILELGAGKNWKKYKEMNENGDEDKFEVTCIDLSYKQDDQIGNITIMSWDVFEYLQTTHKTFDEIKADRIFEHIPYNEIPHLLYLCKEALNVDGRLSFIVPDFQKVFDTVDNLNPHGPASIFNRQMIDIHTEIFNEPEDPHRSVWTMQLADYYMSLEGFWKNIEIKETTLDNRDWYLQISAHRL